MEALVFSILAVLGTYGVSYSLVYLDGPFGIFERIRDVSWIDRFGVLLCVPCSSFYIALPMGLFGGFNLISSIGIWGAVVLLDRLVNFYMVYLENKENYSLPTEATDGQDYDNQPKTGTRVSKNRT